MVGELKPSHGVQEKVLNEAETRWRNYQVIFGSMGDNVEFSMQELVYKELTVEFANASSGAEGFLRSSTTAASTSKTAPSRVYI